MQGPRAGHRVQGSWIGRGGRSDPVPHVALPALALRAPTGRTGVLGPIDGLFAIRTAVRIGDR